MANDASQIYVSESRPGSVHDFELYKGGEALPKNTKVYADSGYQGLDKLHPNAEIPFKRRKNKGLNPEEKLYNRVLSSVRVVIEHVFGKLKIFKILNDPYRNKSQRYNLKFRIIAGILNIKNGFTVL